MPRQESTHPLLDRLNPAQAEAVQHTDGPLLIFAGAGSGKTRVLTHRVAYLIAERGVEPRHILAVTFTNKAAQEMRGRIASLVGERSKSIWMGTFHASCARILREAGDKVGLTRDFVIYDDSDQLTLIRECLFELQLDDKRFTPRSILSHISRAKEKLITPEEFSLHFTGFFEGICNKVYPLYAEKLRRNNALDFDDLMMMAVRLFQQRPDVLEGFQNRCRYILVDEYQDVNYAQYVLLKLLSQKYQNLCVVGDDDQSVYAFRGADVSLILQFEKDFPQARVVKLEQNYRSTKNILEAAYGVVSQNRGRKEKKLWTENEQGGPIVHREAENEILEAEFVVQKLWEGVRSGARKHSDYAILYRTNAQSRAFEEMFLNWATPYRIVGGVRFYERKEVKDILAYLRVIHNPLDSVSLKRILNVPARGIGATSLGVLEKEAEQHGQPLWDVISHADSLAAIQARIRKALLGFVRMVEQLRAVRESVPLTELAQAALDATGYLRDLEAEKNIESETRAENVRELLTVTTEFDATADDRTLGAFLEQVSLVSDLDSLDTKAEAVTLMTLHTAKGLEFPVVFLVGMEEGVFPHIRSMQSDSELEEERRLCYVGITRAKEELYLSHAYRRTLFGNTSYSPPSRFLRDIPEHLVSGPPIAGSRDEDQQSMWHTPPGEAIRPAKLWTSGPVNPRQERVQAATGSGGFRAGDKVRHGTFGKGVVLKAEAVGDDTQVSVAFPDVGVKKLLQSFAKLVRA